MPHLQSYLDQGSYPGGTTRNWESYGDKVELKNNIINKDLKKIIEDKSISSTITYERIIVDLHTGRLFGIIGVTLIDIVTLGMLILSITGTISWMRHKKIF